VATEDWYSERVDYNYNTGTSKNGNAVGHFTAVLWKATTNVGFGYAYGPDGLNYKLIVVAQYTPPGNVQGQYKANVARPARK